MQMVDHSKDMQPQDARQGAVLGHMRYVLAISTIAVVLIFALILLNGV